MKPHDINTEAINRKCCNFKSNPVYQCSPIAESPEPAELQISHFLFHIFFFLRQQFGDSGKLCQQQLMEPTRKRLAQLSMITRKQWETANLVLYKGKKKKKSTYQQLQSSLTNTLLLAKTTYIIESGQLFLPASILYAKLLDYTAIQTITAILLTLLLLS